MVKEDSIRSRGIQNYDSDGPGIEKQDKGMFRDEKVSAGAAPVYGSS
jgi:hypothetical protein